MRKIVFAMRQRKRTNIALAVHSAMSSGRAIALGVAKWAEEAGDWHLMTGDEMHHPRELERMSQLSQGCILISPAPGAVEIVRKFGKPIVLVGDETPGMARVLPDDRAIGRAAFDHLRSLGLTRLATVGIGPTVRFSERREQAFVAAAREHKLTAASYGGMTYTTIAADPHEYTKLMDFLRSIQPPFGLFAVIGQLGVMLTHMVQDMGLAVPQDVAVIGVSDDDLACELCRPRLSAVDDSLRTMGYEAGRLLSRLLKGEPIPSEPIIVPAGGIAARGSTDVMAVEQPDIARAVRYIRQNAVAGIRVADVLKHVAISRRTLERGFARHVGRSMHDEIVRVKVDEAARLLRNTDLQMKEIAGRCGFSDDSKLSTVFRLTMGSTPREYRRRTVPLG
jgi:LacI family transcriptional regulator